MRRDLLRRLAKLEERRPNPLPLLRTVCITDFIEEPRRKTLAPGERIVLDWYRDVNFEVLARERITSDPCDQGHRCEPIPPLPRGYTEREAPSSLQSRPWICARYVVKSPSRLIE